MPASIFISHASKDHAVAETICKAVEHRGYSCWLSSRDIDPGENFQEAIVHAIRTAKVMIFVFSGNSNNSEEVKKEMALASRRNLLTIPLRVEDVTPNEAFDYEFATRQWIDAFDGWEDAIERLIARISAVVGVAPAREIAADPAKKPVGEPLPSPATADEADPTIDEIVITVGGGGGAYRSGHSGAFPGCCVAAPCRAGNPAAASGGRGCAVAEGVPQQRPDLAGRRGRGPIAGDRRRRLVDCHRASESGGPARSHRKSSVGGGNASARGRGGEGSPRGSSPAASRSGGEGAPGR
jgi:hypothetical protein